MSLEDRYILITGSARRIGRALALGLARAGAHIIIHHAHSPGEAEETRDEIRAMGREAEVLAADLTVHQQVMSLVHLATQVGPLYALINSAAIFEALEMDEVNQENWQRHLDLNLAAPFFLSQSFSHVYEAGTSPEAGPGRILNILDWRALRPGADHFPYTISKAGLAALTRSLAVALAPRITVNGLALGAILPPSDGGAASRLIEMVPAGRWAKLDEVVQAAEFFLDGPGYITGEILHLDGGRHLV